MYRRIGEDLRRQIENRELPPGSQLRTEIELREQYNASRNTVRDAIKWLVTRGLVETRPGQGIFVVETIVPFVTTLTGEPKTVSGGKGVSYSVEVDARFRKASDTPPQVEIEHASAHMAAELELFPGEAVVSRHQQRYIDSTPWSLQTSSHRMDLVQQGVTRLIQTGDSTKGTAEYLRESVGIKKVGYGGTITVRAPDNAEAGFFRLPRNGRISIIGARSAAFDEQGIPALLTFSVDPVERNQIAVDVGVAAGDRTLPLCGQKRAGRGIRRIRRC